MGAVYVSRSGWRKRSPSRLLEEHSNGKIITSDHNFLTGGQQWVVKLDWDQEEGQMDGVYYICMYHIMIIIMSF